MHEVLRSSSLVLDNLFYKHLGQKHCICVEVVVKQLDRQISFWQKPKEYSVSNNSRRSLNMEEFNEVIFEFKKSIRRAILNRPGQLNSLTFEMISQMLKQLGVFEEDPTVKLVILKGKGRAFCAGGDVKGVINFVTNGHWSFGASFFRRQLTLDYKIATFKKPVVSILNGFVMGGGAGLSMLSTFRIVTEKTIFAMPEASIGVFPDCGASYFFSRIPGYFGEYLGLTGTRLTGIEMLHCGLATHFVLSKDLTSLEDSLDSLGASESMVIDERTILRTIN
ncbi:OLC1v1012136C2 [Oldenlandia corymbosa var. corymbosa]|uniref:3-hydroxyisobutyryl-CoA hydrolase n=1 Tax=Oldenlandia corymbosa var. corymbosa TaxID=529605 RepID=A0AAV1DYN2_OLDCO|nr:OLC1v1012136C2 [Oldenlandia corymbosa var. corymbosa]